MQKNQYGTVKVEGQGGTLIYQVHFDPQQSIDSPPTAEDLQIPASEEHGITQTLKTLNLKGKSAPEVLDRLSLFFTQNFRYSLKLAASGQQASPVSAFLLKKRAGHCEYFATATTLLLRGAGIPARYAVGYSVHEWSPLEKQYIVRSQNAHAWVMAYVNGTWQSIDTTPPDWTAQEAATASPLQAISDLFSFLSFQASKGFGQLTGGRTVAVLSWAIAPGFLFLLWRFGRKLRFQRSAEVAIVPEQHLPLIQKGMDSEFYRIELVLIELGLHRLPDESWSQWMFRIKAHLPEQQYITLKQILDLHHRYRFDPQGIESREREQLKMLSQAWLERYSI
jgi:hypothetical protein